MSKEKQIEEMADDVRRIRESYFGQADYLFAMKLYEDGYRKQSEGHWMTHHCTNGGTSPRGRTIIYKTLICDRCGKSNGRHKTNFCPHCGAKMKGV
jgi:hypothetical protein